MVELLLMLALASMTPRVAYAGRAARAVDVVADSSQAVEAAKQAQARFERRRLRWADRDRTGTWGGECDERLGRMCLRFEEGGDWWPGDEDPDLVEAREALLEELAQAARTAPGDPWILGQRVVYLGEAGRWGEAGLLARQCPLAADRWWCDALLGLSLHARGRFVEAEAAFRDALAGMPPEQARQWQDMKLLLDGDGRHHLDDLDHLAADRRERGIAAFWRLADPLWLVPGNDRLTEHFARRVVARTRSDARNPYAMSWGSDLDDLLVRYGWEIGWERTEPRPGELGMRGSALGHQHPYSESYVPTGKAWRDPTDVAAEAWIPGARDEPRTGYAPGYAPVLLPVDAQVAVLPRGDRVVVVAKPFLPDDTTYHGGHDHPPLPLPDVFQGASDQEGLFLADSTGEAVIARVSAPGTDAPLVVEAPAGRYLLSLETWSPARRRAGRLRRPVVAPATPPDIPTLSDLLVLAPGGGEPTRLSDIEPYLLPGARASAGDTLRIAWEVYGLGWRSETLSYRLTLTRVQGGLLHAAGRFLGLVGDPRQQSLDWLEPAPEEPGPHLRAVDLTLPDDLDAGRYRLRLELASDGRTTLQSERILEVVPRRAPFGP